MSVSISLDELVGDYEGTYRLIRSWETPPQSDSQSVASIVPVARGRFLTMRYTWAIDGTPHEGMLLLGREQGGNAVSAVWVDSWHMSEKPLICTGRLDDGTITVVGSYAAPPGPDWRWRTELVPGDGTLLITMYNISPGGEEELAVESRYTRR